jgi:hypothetical protein
MEDHQPGDDARVLSQAAEIHHTHRTRQELRQTSVTPAVIAPVPAPPSLTQESQPAAALPVVAAHLPRPPRTTPPLPLPRAQMAWPGAAQDREQGAAPVHRFTPPFSAATVERVRPQEIALRVQLPQAEGYSTSRQETAVQPPFSAPLAEEFSPDLFETMPSGQRRLGYRLWRRGRTIGFLRPAELQGIEQRLQRRFLDRTVRRGP